VVGQPNVVASLVMKAVSCALSQRHHLPHCVQSRRCACGPLLEPMVAIWLPQRQAWGIRTFRPTTGEGADDGADSADDGGKRLSCMCSPVSAPLSGCPIWDYVRRARDDVIPLIDGLGTALARAARGRVLLRPRSRGSRRRTACPASSSLASIPSARLRGCC